MELNKIKLNCICHGHHSIEITLDSNDKDWSCIISMLGVHRGFFQKIKDFFKTDWFVDDIIIDDDQLKSLYMMLKLYLSKKHEEELENKGLQKAEEPFKIKPIMEGQNNLRILIIMENTMNSKKEFISLAELGLEMTIPKSRLAFYKKIGLISPTAKISNMDLYNYKDIVEKINKIKELQEKGLSLDEIKNKI